MKKQQQEQLQQQQQRQQQSRQQTCCSCFRVEAVSSPLAMARILAAREAPLADAGGMCPLETILIESFLLLSSDCCCENQKQKTLTAVILVQ